LISLQLINTVGNFCSDSTDKLCNQLKNWLSDNTNWMMSQIYDNPDDPYWHQVYLTLVQFSGLVQGYLDNSEIFSPEAVIKSIFNDDESFLLM
jgi:hypothetical protein